MASLSKQINDLTKLVTYLAGIESWAPGANERFQQRMSALLPAYEAGSIPLDRLIEVVLQLLKAKLDALEQAEQVHAAELSDDPPVRARRESLAAEILAILVEIRASAQANYGPEIPAKLMLAGTTPRDPALVARTAEGLLQVIGKPDFALPRPRTFGAPLDPARWQEALAAPVAQLKTTLDDVGREVREASGTLRQRNECWDDLEVTYRKSANLLKAIFEYVGLDDLAEKIRPPLPRSSGEEPEVAPEQPAAPGAELTEGH